MMQTASKISLIADQQDDRTYIQDTTELVKASPSRVAIMYPDGELWVSNTSSRNLLEFDETWTENDARVVRSFNREKEDTKG